MYICYIASNISTNVSWEEAGNYILGKTRIAISSEQRTSRKPKSKHSFDGATENRQVISSVSGFNDCSPVSETIVIKSEHFANRRVGGEGVETRESYNQINKKSSNSTLVKVSVVWVVGKKVVAACVHCRIGDRQLSPSITKSPQCPPGYVVEYYGIIDIAVGIE